MAPPLSSLLSLSFAIALLATIFVAATLRLIAILPSPRSNVTPWPKRPIATRVLIVLGSGGHTHEMFDLLRDLDTRKYTHRTYVVSSGDAFSAQRAVKFERMLEEREKEKQKSGRPGGHVRDKSPAQIKITDSNGVTRTRARGMTIEDRPACTGPQHYNIAEVPRARKIHQSLLTTPLSCLWTLVASFAPLLGASMPKSDKMTPYDAAAADLPDLIITNGPATAVIMILASLILKFVNWRGIHSRGKARTMYVESFTRVKTLSLSGKLLLRVVDRFLVQWEELEGAGGRAEFCGILV